MPLDMDYFRAIQGSLGCTTEKDVRVERIRRQFSLDFDTSINAVYDTLRNGVQQDFIITPTKSETVCAIKPRPDEQLFIGDIIDYCSDKWIVTKVKTNTGAFRDGIIEKCNYQMRYQLFDEKIFKQWSLITESYSEVSSNGKIISVPIGRTVILLPYTENTRRLHKDKRLMLETVFTKDNEEIGVVYSITGFDGKLHDMGVDGRLLELTIESNGDYLSSVDNLQEMICDYIKPISPTPPIDPDPTLLKCEISGRDSIKIGGSARKYIAKFYENDGVTEIIDGSVVPKWEFICLPEHEKYFVLSQNDHFIDIRVLNYEGLTDTKIKLVLADTNGLYQPYEMFIDIVDASR